MNLYVCVTACQVLESHEVQYGLGDWAVGIRFLGRRKIHFCLVNFLESAQPPIERVPELEIDSLHPERIHGVIPPSRHGVLLN